MARDATLCIAGGMMHFGNGCRDLPALAHSGADIMTIIAIQLLIPTMKSMAKTNFKGSRILRRAPVSAWAVTCRA